VLNTPAGPPTISWRKGGTPNGVGVLRRDDLVVADAFYQTETWLVDEGLATSARNGMRFASRLCDADHFAITNDVVVPIPGPIIEEILADALASPAPLQSVWVTTRALQPLSIAPHSMAGSQRVASINHRQPTSEWPKSSLEAPLKQNPRYVFISPYFKETRDYLERCIASVKHQTLRADHIVVSDGFPQEWLDQASIRHVRLDRAHGDYGNTPRGVGSLMAIAEGYDGIGLLDADCWLEPDHLEHCLAQAEKVGGKTCGFVVASRTFRRPDQSIINVVDEPPALHVDTNCFFFLPPSFSVLPVWALMPREISSICDRVFFLALRARNFISAITIKKTVNFTYTYAPLYRSLGEVPPRPIKENPDHRAIRAWIDALPPKQLELINQRLGANLQALYRPVSVLVHRSESTARVC
jgi:hypothetical protein